MKKSTRILAILMAFVMLLGSFTVLGSAYDAYKGDAIKGQYNDVDAVDFTLDQYASMGLDEVDRMLAKEQMVLDIYIGTLNLSSINTAITSVHSLIASVSTLLPLLGDASGLAGYVEDNLTGVQRTANGKDIDVVYALLNFVASLNPIVTKYVNGTVTLGIMNSFIADFIFDVRTLAIGLLYGMSFAGEQAGYDAMDDGANGLPEKYLNTTNGALTLLQDLLNELILGEWKQLDSELDPANKWSIVMEESYAFYDVASVSANGEVTYKLDKDGNKILVAGEAIDIVKYDYYGWVDNNDWVTVGLGDAFRVPAGSPAPAASYDVVDITTNRTGYDFIETLMQQAYNYILVPVLKRDTIDWVRKLCGVEYDSTKTARTIFNSATGKWENNPAYDPDYRGEPFDPATDGTVYAKFLNPNVDISTVTIPKGETFVDNFNDILGTVLDSAAIVPRDTDHTTADGTFHWEWQDGSNAYLFNNICSVAKFILSITQDLFFSEYVKMPTPTEIADMTNQEVVAFVMRAILNSSVDYIYIDDTYTTVVDVAYRAVEQLAWQDIPQYTYTKPVKGNMTDNEYYLAVVEKMIDILFDIAVYNLNQGFDMVPASGKDPEKGEGLLQYQGDEGSYKNNLIQIVAWAISEYGAILNLDFFCDDNDGAVTGNRTLTENDVWNDLDTLINAIIPIKGDGAWLAKEIAGDGSTIVSKTLIFDYLLKPIYTLDATNFATIFKKNPDGAFANQNGVTIIIDFLEGIFELLFPGVFQRQTSIDAILNNELLGAMVGDLIKVLGTKNTKNAKGEDLAAQGPDIAKVALPLVCMLLGLSDDQEFAEMEIYMPETISASGAAPSFDVFNGSSGINTAYTDKSGTVHQDQLYTYKIVKAYVRTYDASGTDTGAITQNAITEGATIAGGDKITVTLNGTRTKGNLVEFEVIYSVLDENGAALTTQDLSKTVYAYIGETAEDDDAITKEIVAAGDRKIQYNPSIYLSSGDDLDDIEGYSIRIKDIGGGATAAASIVSVNNASSDYPFVAMNPGDKSRPITQNMTGEEGLYFLSPFNVAEKAAGEYYERYEDFYQTDENGDLVLDDNDEPIVIDNNKGVINGQYNVTTKVNVAGGEHEVTTYIHLYNDYGLDSLFDRAVAANRQKSDYGIGYQAAWNVYTAALAETARFVLKPKTGSSFAADIVAKDPTKYENRYEELAVALEAAIEDLDSYAVSAGVEGLKEDLAEYSGLNYTVKTDSNGRKYKVDLEYDDDNYIYFGMRDYVPHTYNKYRDARDRITDLIDSQSVFVLAPFEEGYEPTADEQSAYDASVAAYDEKINNLPVISSIEATYASHMLDLVGQRLIRLKADTSKLQIVYDMCKDALEEGASYTADSLERYNRAIAFTEEVLATPIVNDFGAYDLRPSKVNEATTELMVAWKHLAKSASYGPVEAAIELVQETIDTYGMDADAQTTFSTESYKALLDAYDAALNIEQDLSDTDSNNAYIKEIADNLTNAFNALEGAQSKEAVVEFNAPDSLDDEFIFYDINGNQGFTPYVSEATYNAALVEATLADGTPVDGFIVGFGEIVSDEETALKAFGKLENVRAEVTPSDPINNVYGTGTLIQLYNEATGALEKTYHVVVIGDINGDGVVDGSMDVPFVWNNYYGDTEWGYNSYEEYEYYKYAAADINNDGGVDTMDIAYWDNVLFTEGYINQEISSEFGVCTYVSY